MDTNKQYTVINLYTLVTLPVTGLSNVLIAVKALRSTYPYTPFVVIDASGNVLDLD